MNFETEQAIRDNNFAIETQINQRAVRPTQHDKLMHLLTKYKNEWVPLPEILKLGIAQYNARLKELRAVGYTILNKSEWEDGIRKSWFKYVPKLNEELF